MYVHIYSMYVYILYVYLCTYTLLSVVHVTDACMSVPIHYNSCFVDFRLSV